MRTSVFSCTSSSIKSGRIGVAVILFSNAAGSGADKGEKSKSKPPNNSGKDPYFGGFYRSWAKTEVWG